MQRLTSLTLLLALGCGASSQHASEPASQQRTDLACVPASACDESDDAWPSVAAYRGWAPSDQHDVPASILAPMAPLPLCAVETATQTERWTRDARGLPTSYELESYGELRLRAIWEHDAEGLLVREVVERVYEPVHVTSGADSPTFVDGRPERITTWRRDPDGTLHESIDENGDGAVDREIVRSFDAHGVARRVVRVRCGPGAREGSEERTWERDERGRVVAEQCTSDGARWSEHTTHVAAGPSVMRYQRDDDDGARVLEQRWTYDDAGRLVREGFDADRDGELDTWREYEITTDAEGRVSALRIVPHGDGHLPAEHRWTFDAEARLADHAVTRGAAGGNIPYRYDEQGRLATLYDPPATVTLRYECE